MLYGVFLNCYVLIFVDRKLLPPLTGNLISCFTEVICMMTLQYDVMLSCTQIITLDDPSIVVSSSVKSQSVSFLSSELRSLLKRRLNLKCTHQLSLPLHWQTSQMSKPWWTPSTLFQVWFTNRSPNQSINDCVSIVQMKVNFLVNICKVVFDTLCSWAP